MKKKKFSILSYRVARECAGYLRKKIGEIKKKKEKEKKKV